MSSITSPTSVTHQFHISMVAAGYVNKRKLAKDLEEVAYVPLITEDAGNYTVFFTGEPLTAEQTASVNSIVASHDPNVVNEKITAFQNRTRQLIEGGFEYPTGSGNFFPIELEARVSLIAVYLLKDNPQMTYPIRWNSITPGVSHELADAAAVEDFFFTAFATARGIIDSETTLRDQVEAALSPADAAAITDPR